MSGRILGAIERGISTFDQVLGEHMLGALGDADAEADCGLDRAQAVRQRDAGMQATGKIEQIVPAGLALAEHDELVAPEARHHVIGMHCMLEALGDADQQLIAGGVPIAIIDLLEVVEIEVKQRKRLVAGEG